MQKQRRFFSFKKEKEITIIKGVNGVIRPGELVAVMGASGSGKTTLLNALSGRNCNNLIVQGSITVNGQYLGKRIRAISAYVQQESVFVEKITVKEHILFHALLRLPRDMPLTRKFAQVEEALKEFGLRDCENSIIRTSSFTSGISGGEAKRVEVASQLLTKPSIVFCDEPTTGLDSFMSESVVATLQRLASSGNTILCTIHQPPSSVFSMFNKVLFLADGRVAFFGPTTDALSFLGSIGFICPSAYSPADFIINCLSIDPSSQEECKQRITKICQQFQQSEYANLTEIPKLQPSGEKEGRCINLLTATDFEASWLQQLFCLLWRSAVNISRSKTVYLVRYIQKIIFAVFIGLLYFDTKMDQAGVMNLNGVFFFFIAHFSFPVIFTTLNVLPKEYPVIYREYQDFAYKPSSYYVSKVLLFILIYSLDGLLFLLIAYFMIGLRHSTILFLQTFAITFLIEQSACSFASLLSAASPSLPISLVIVGPILTIVQLTGGFFANVGTIPLSLSWIQHLSWFRQAYEAYLITQWSGVQNISMFLWYQRMGECSSLSSLRSIDNFVHSLRRRRVEKYEL